MAIIAIFLTVHLLWNRTKFINFASRIMLAEAGSNLVVNVFANLLLPIKNHLIFLIENQGVFDYNVGTVGILVKNSVPWIICDFDRERSW